MRLSHNMSGNGKPQHAPNEKFGETMMNMTLLDPPRWGWTAIGGVADLLPPHERARRKESKRAFLNRRKRKRGRPSTTSTTNTASLKPPPPSSSSQAAPVSSSEQPVADGSTQNHQNESKPTEKEIQQKQQQQQQQQQPSSEAGKVGTPEAADSERQADQKELPTSNESDRGENQSDNGNLQTHGESEKDSETVAKNPESKIIDKTAESGDTTKPSVSFAATTTNAAEGAPAKPLTDPAESKPTQLSEQGTEKEQNTVADGVPQREPNIFSKGSESAGKVLEVKALREDGSLDIYAYHRGREGMEPRDDTTGELLCDVPITDSNWDFDEPKMSTQIKIEFPLSDDKNLPSSEIPMYEDTVLWDLADPETPTPMAFAVDVAENFGLTFGQTVELAQSVQLQLYDFIKENCGYAVPIALSDGTGTERTHFTQPSYPYLYGDVFEDPKVPKAGTTYNFTRYPSKSKSKTKSIAPAAGPNNRRSAPMPEDRRPLLHNDPEEEVEQKYIEEVKKRMGEFSREDVAAKSMNSSEPRGKVEMKLNYVCHICHKRHNLVGQFPCDHPTHSYCKGHMKNRLGVTINSATDLVTLEECPICSVKCACSRCGRRREALAKELKRLCQEQGVEPTDAVYEDMFKSYTKPTAVARVYKSGTTARRRDSIESAASVETKGSATKGSTTKGTEEPTPPTKKAKTIRYSANRLGDLVKLNVPKADPSEFPSEVRGSVDIDPGTSADYLTVFTAVGNYRKEPEAKAAPATQSVPASKPRVPEGTEVVEDGNVDYCHKCRKHGNLVCCDYCPRAFHPSCIEDGDGESGGKWECHVCRREKQDLPEYTLTGNDSMPIICAAYSSLNATCDEDLTQLSVLSKIHEMIQKLMQYDFGYIFCEPVDCKQVPGYRKIIKKPMDLGTIGKRLVNGYYKKFFEAHKSWDDVHLAVLKDIELVWHNCFTFNFEGSSINRMAEVHRKRMVKMLDRSINKDLSETVKEKLREYVTTCKRERGKFPASDEAPPLAADPNQLRPDVRPESKHKITAKMQKGGVTKPVAVFDPDTGMIVKIYSTMKSAATAAEFLLGRGHKSELPQVTDNTIKALVHRSAQDPTATLFGYRWLQLSKLRERQVNFTKPLENGNETIHSPTNIFEMADGKCTYIFLSIEEALSSPKLSKGFSADELRKKLAELPEGGESILAFGMKWRRLKPAPPADSEKKGKAKKRESGVSLTAFWRFGKENRPANCSAHLSPNAIIAKEDVIIRRILAGFDTLDAAFEDWRQACMSSPTVAEDEITAPNFHTYYLDGDRNVDGIVWKTVDKDSISQEIDKVPNGYSADSSLRNCGAYQNSQSKNIQATEGSKMPSSDCAPTTKVGYLNGLSDTNGTSSHFLENGHPTPKKSIEVGATAVETQKNGLKRGRSEEDVLQPRKK